MKTVRSHSSALFLFELIISILFFSVAAAFCVQFIAKAHTISEGTGQYEKAFNECSSIAEIVSASQSMEAVCEGILLFRPEAVVENIDEDQAVIRIFYDEAFNCSAEEEADVVLTAQLSQEDNMIYAQINAGDIYSLSSAKHVRIN